MYFHCTGSWIMIRKQRCLIFIRLLQAAMYPHVAICTAKRLIWGVNILLSSFQIYLRGWMDHLWIVLIFLQRRKTDFPTRTGGLIFTMLFHQRRHRGGRRELEACGCMKDLQGSLASCLEEGCSDLWVLRELCGTWCTRQSQELQTARSFQTQHLPTTFPGVDAWALFIPASCSLCAGAGMYLNHPQRASSALWSPGKQPRAGGAMDQGFFRAPCSALPCSNWMLRWLGA